MFEIRGRNSHQRNQSTSREALAEGERQGRKRENYYCERIVTQIPPDRV